MEGHWIQTDMGQWQSLLYDTDKLSSLPLSASHLENGDDGTFVVVRSNALMIKTIDIL